VISGWCRAHLRVCVGGEGGGLTDPTTIHPSPLARDFPGRVPTTLSEQGPNGGGKLAESHSHQRSERVRRRRITAVAQAQASQCMHQLQAAFGLPTFTGQGLRLVRGWEGLAARLKTHTSSTHNTSLPNSMATMKRRQTDSMCRQGGERQHKQLAQQQEDKSDPPLSSPTSNGGQRGVCGTVPLLC
jgi:hypothetical protein